MMQSDTGYICTRMAIFTMDCNQSCQKNHIGILLLYLEYLRLYIYDTVYLVSEYVLIHTYVILLSILYFIGYNTEGTFGII